MITVSLLVSMTLILIISFALISKKNNPLNLIFVFMSIEYLFTSFISVIADNEKLWKVSVESWHFLMFRITEVIIIPLMLLLYLEIERRLTTSAKRFLLLIAATFILVGIERTLPILDIMEYKLGSMGIIFRLIVPFDKTFLLGYLDSLLGTQVCFLI